MADRSAGDDDLSAIASKLAAALRAAPPPWEAFLETRNATGGSSFIRLGSDADADDEIHLNLLRSGEAVVSPDAGLDDLLDFLTAAPTMVSKLLDEVRRQRRANPQ